MESENSVARQPAPPWLLIALGLAVVLLVANWMWPTSSATPVVPASNQARAPPAAAGSHDGRSGRPGRSARGAERRASGCRGRWSAIRSGFNRSRRHRRRRREADAAAGDESRCRRRSAARAAAAAADPVEVHRDRREAGPEGRGVERLPIDATVRRRGGRSIDGRYRLVRIGVESIVIEYVDGRGRTTVRLDGCPAR